MFGKTYRIAGPVGAWGTLLEAFDGLLVHPALCPDRQARDTQSMRQGDDYRVHQPEAPDAFCPYRVFVAEFQGIFSAPEG